MTGSFAARLSLTISDCLIHSASMSFFSQWYFPSQTKGKWKLLHDHSKFWILSTNVKDNREREVSIELLRHENSKSFAPLAWIWNILKSVNTLSAPPSTPLESRVNTGVFSSMINGNGNASFRLPYQGIILQTVVSFRLVLNLTHNFTVLAPITLDNPQALDTPFMCVVYVCDLLFDIIFFNQWHSNVDSQQRSWFVFTAF